MKIFRQPESDNSQGTDNTNVSDPALVDEDDCTGLPHGPQVPGIFSHAG